MKKNIKRIQFTFSNTLIFILRNLESELYFKIDGRTESNYQLLIAFCESECIKIWYENVKGQELFTSNDLKKSKDIFNFICEVKEYMKNTEKIVNLTKKL